MKEIKELCEFCETENGSDICYYSIYPLDNDCAVDNDNLSCTQAFNKYDVECPHYTTRQTLGILLQCYHVKQARLELGIK